MTPRDHNKVIGIMHLIYGGFFTLMSLLMLVFFGFFAAILGSIPEEPNAPPMGFLLAIFGFVVVIYALLSLPGLVAGYAMLKRKPWARVAGIVASVLAAVSFPFGTALCVYTLWFLFGQQGENFHRAGGGQMYGRGFQSPPLPDASTYGWDAQRASQAGRQRDYVPPPQPPDWRGQ